MAPKDAPPAQVRRSTRSTSASATASASAAAASATPTSADKKRDSSAAPAGSSSPAGKKQKTAAATAAPGAATAATAAATAATAAAAASTSRSAAKDAPAQPAGSAKKDTVASAAQESDAAPVLAGAAKSGGRLKLGDALPDFRLLDQDGATVTLADVLSHCTSASEESLKGVVLFSYPAASTPGCTAQACSYRDNSVLPESSATTADGGEEQAVVKQRFLKDEPGFLILGISTDTPAAQGKFAKGQKLPYTLLSDKGGEGLLKRLGGVTVAKKTSQRCHWIAVAKPAADGSKDKAIAELIDISIGTKPKDCVATAVAAIQAYRKKSGEK